MQRPRGQRDRPRREAKTPKAGKRRDQENPASRKFQSHPLYGEIPLLPIGGADGEGGYYTYDPDFAPRLPNGAVRGDVWRQHFCPMCHTPKYFYVDQDRRCVQCGDDFVFAAREQKYWYESLHFHFDSVAIRCARCRGKRRTEKALREQMSAARQGLRENPDDPALLLADAEACVRYRQRTGEGDIDRAIASARRAAKIWPDGVEALFWEGLAHKLASRQARAKATLQAFIARSAGRKRYRKQAKEAQTVLEELAAADG